MSSKHKSKKDRRHSGQYTPKILDTKMKFNDIKIQALEPISEYDEWLSWKDGMRDKIYLEWKRKDKKKTHKVTKANKTKHL